MIAFAKKISFSENRLLLYKFSSQDLEMDNRKKVKSISGGLKITESDDNFLKKMSSLKGEKKFIRGKMAYMLFSLGMEEFKKQIKEELGKETEISYLNKREILQNNKNLDAIFNMVNLLKENGLTLEVKKAEDETK